MLRDNTRLIPGQTYEVSVQIDTVDVDTDRVIGAAGLSGVRALIVAQPTDLVAIHPSLDVTLHERSGAAGSFWGDFIGSDIAAHCVLGNDYFRIILRDGSIRDPLALRCTAPGS